MTRSFGLVEDKLREAEYFFGLLSKTSPHSRKANYCFSAFVSAARSVTWTLQACLSDVEGFRDWYFTCQESLKSDALAPHFVEFRNKLQKTGENPLGQVAPAHLRQYLAGQFNGTAPTHVLVHPSTEQPIDAVGACDSYLTSLTQVVYDCYMQFRTIVDPQWYFTQEAFQASGKTLADAIREMGCPEAWSDAAPRDQDAWPLLSRLNPGCAMNDLFQARLGKVVPGPYEWKAQRSFESDLLRGST